MTRFSEAALLAAAAAVLCACGQDPKAQSMTPQELPAVPVLTAVAGTADVPVTVSAIGTVEAFNTVQVKTMVGGELTRAPREGEVVRRGDLLFSIDPRALEATVAQATATLARDRAQLQNARVEEQRNAELVAKEYVTREQYDRSRTAVDTAAATVQADEAALLSARVQLSYCTVRSPIDGRVGRLLINVGNVVKANDVPLVTITQVRPIRVAFAVPEAQLGTIRRRVAAGAVPVLAGPQNDPGHPVQGTLDFIDNAVDRATGTILLKARFANDDDALWPGQFVNVKLDIATKNGAVVVPTPAVQNGQQGPFVFVVKADQSVESRKVRLGPAAGDVTAIEDGLAAGDTVVTDGQLRLFPGARVKTRGETK